MGFVLIVSKSPSEMAKLPEPAACAHCVVLPSATTIEPAVVGCTDASYKFHARYPGSALNAWGNVPLTAAGVKAPDVVHTSQSTEPVYAAVVLRSPNRMALSPAKLVCKKA